MKTCSKCHIEKDVSEFRKDRSRKDGRYPSCKKCCKHFETKYIDSNYNRDRCKQYRNAHIDEIRKKDRIRRSTKIPTIKERILHRLRSRIYSTVKHGYKSSSTLSLLGCSFEEFRCYIESKFTTGMSWKNYGSWHIDHIVPCAYYDLTKIEDQQKCFHYTNLQPLWAIDNLRKGKFFTM